MPQPEAQIAEDQQTRSNWSLFGNREERAAKKAERERQRESVRAELRERFETAEASAARGETLEEEVALQEAGFVAAKQSSWRWNSFAEFERMLAEWTTAGRVRRAEAIGFADNVFIWADRIVCVDEIREKGVRAGIHLMDDETHAEIMTEGELRTTTRPTLTRMAVGSVLPGTALIPGFAFQKKQTVDDRRLFFTIEQGDWGKIVELDPQKVDIGEMRQIVMAVNSTARRIASQEAEERTTRMDSDSALDRLRKLAELRDAGVVTDEEFATKKAALLDSIY